MKALPLIALFALAGVAGAAEESSPPAPLALDDLSFEWRDARSGSVEIRSRDGRSTTTVKRERLSDASGLAANGPVRFAGVGNVAATVIDGGRRRSMVSLPGILGEQRREAREFSYEKSPQALLVLHSDGLTDRWDLAAYPGLVAQPPVMVAATLIRDAAKRHDDASVLVATVS